MTDQDLNEKEHRENVSGTDGTLDGEIHHISNPVLSLPPVEKKYLGAVTGYSQEGNSYYFTDGKSRIEIKIVNDDIIRVRLAPQGDFLPDFSYAVIKPEPRVTVFTFEETDSDYLVKTGTVICRIHKADAFISFENYQGTVINGDAATMHWEINEDYGGYYVYCSKKVQGKEAFYGLGDKPTHLNLSGKRFTNWNSDTYSFSFDQDPLYRSIPFYIGLHGGVAYGIFFDNSFRTYFDFACEETDKTSFWSEGGELNYYFINGPDMIDVVRRYHSITGSQYLPPLWALGYHQCRWSYYPEEKVRQLAQSFREWKIPCDAIYLDIDYMDGYRCFTWNRKSFPNPARMIKDLDLEGFKTVVIIDPGIKVDENYSVYQEGREHHYFCRRGDDYFMEGYVWPGNCRFPDFTNPKVRKWWGSLFRGLVDNGVAGVWNDMNEPAVFGKGTFPNDVRHYYEGYRGSHRKTHNVYGMQMVRATYEGLKKLMQNRRPFTITRSAYAGTQRYASVWTGDNYASWEHLKIGVLQLQRLSVSGMSFCGTDIGGFSGEPDGELFTRWIQFGVFSPFMRAHSSGDTREREPWSFGEPFTSINRKFIELRYRFLPYIYAVFWENVKLGNPVLRPLVMMEQDNEDLRVQEDGYCFGSKIYVSPVVESGQVQKMVYLPSGKWFDYWTHKFYEGGQQYLVPTPLDSIPLFVKGGTVLPQGAVVQSVRFLKMDSFELNVYYSEGEKCSYIYEDLGDSFDYEHGIYLEKKFTVKGSWGLFSITQAVNGGSYGERYHDYDMKIIGLPFVPVKLYADGAEVDFVITEGVMTFRVPKDFDELIVQQ